MIRFDFALPLRCAWFDGIAMNTQLRQTLTKDVGFEGTAEIELKAIRQSPLTDRAFKDSNGCVSIDVSGCKHREYGATVIINDREDVYVQTSTVLEIDAKRSLGIQLPAFVRCLRFITIPYFVALPLAQCLNTGKQRVLQARLRGPISRHTAVVAVVTIPLS